MHKIKINHSEMHLHKEPESACLLSLLSAANAAATEGGKCLRLSVGLLLVPATLDGTAANSDSMSFSVRKG